MSWVVTTRKVKAEETTYIPCFSLKTMWSMCLPCCGEAQMLFCVHSLWRDIVSFFSVLRASESLLSSSTIKLLHCLSLQMHYSLQKGCAPFCVIFSHFCVTEAYPCTWVHIGGRCQFLLQNKKWHLQGQHKAYKM